MVACIAQCENCLCLRGMTRACGQRRHAAFERSNALFKHIGGRVHQAGVDVSQLFEREQIRGVFRALELIARCLIQRHGAAARGGVGRIARV
jgi:hypothetical protein